MGPVAVDERERLREDYRRVRGYLRREQALKLRYWNRERGEAAAADIAVTLAALRRLGEAVGMALDDAGRVE